MTPRPAVAFAREHGVGNGEPASVFVHGWSCDRSYWRAQLDRFAASHRVVGVDLGGRAVESRRS